MEVIKESDYKREVTHTQYRHGDKKTKKGGRSRILQHHISDDRLVLTQDWLDNKENFLEANDKFVQIVEPAHITPIWGGGFFLLMFLSFLFVEFRFSEQNTHWGYILAIVLFFLGFLFFVVYYFTMPEKEYIWNREDGLITFPGFMWKPNITMPVQNVMFVISSPSPQGGGAFQLRIARPDYSYSLYEGNVQYNCYEDLSFLLWYMDKNRPLPPGDAFNPYRERDYERRKAAGFPSPLFVSAFDTPEATPEQQTERQRIGGW